MMTLLKDLSLFDTHMHLDYFPDTHPEVIQRALDHGIEGMVTIGTSLGQTPLLKSYADLYSCLYYTVGQHPHEAEGVKDIPFEELKETLIGLKDHPKMIAYGETGLDYYYNHSPKQEQISSFKAHIEASLHRDLPVIVHTRDAQDDTISVLREYKGSGLKGVIHCFSGTQELADFAIDEMDFLISFSGIVTFPKAIEIQNVAAKAPLRSIVIETDSPYLAPIPHRGKQNEPMHVRHVFEKLCFLRPCDAPEVLASSLRDNVKRVFGV